ncbi:MAG: DUF763 domain-containing protein [Bacteroidota bacterium]
MKQSGSADLALMGGGIPKWLFERMVKLSLPIIEAILIEKGQADFLARMANPYWFQSFGAVIGMDWNSSGVTTAVMGALRKALNPHAKTLGLYVCGGKGKHSLKTPQELLRVGDQTGLDGHELARFSKLSAKVDNTAVQDGFQLYLHNFLVSDKGDWTVIQQGMKPQDSSARRYHWHSANIQSFVEEPHAAICGENQGVIFNLVDKQAASNKQGILNIVQEDPARMLKEIPKVILPKYHEVKAKDVNLKRLGSILWLAQEAQTRDFEELLLLKGVGPRTLQSLSLVSEIIHGAPARFDDPARFSFAHGGKNARPFPVPTKVYDETISVLSDAVDKAKIGASDKQKAIAQLSKMAQKAEEGFTPNTNFDELIEKEKRDSWKYGGRTKSGFVKPPPNQQLGLFDDQDK